MPRLNLAILPLSRQIQDVLFEKLLVDTLGDDLVDFRGKLELFRDLSEIVDQVLRDGWAVAALSRGEQGQVIFRQGDEAEVTRHEAVEHEQDAFVDRDDRGSLADVNKVETWDRELVVFGRRSSEQDAQHLFRGGVPYRRFQLQRLSEIRVTSLQTLHDIQHELTAIRALIVDLATDTTLADPQEAASVGVLVAESADRTLISEFTELETRREAVIGSDKDMLCTASDGSISSSIASTQAVGSRG